jgi:hypothetical protein
LTVPGLEQRQRRIERVVNRRAAPAAHRIECRTEHFRRRRPTRGDRRLVIEQHERELVIVGHQLEEEAVERAPRILQPLADHAVADVEKRGKTDRHALAGELRNRLELAVFENFELVFREIRYESAVGIGNSGSDRDDLDAGLKLWCLRRLRRTGIGKCQHERRDAYARRNVPEDPSAR